VQEGAQFDVKLKAKFDHELGTLSSRGREPAAPAAQPVATGPTSAAAQLAAMLANPEGLRQAVMMNEILRRPSERW
jgi:hypothetical protein